MKGNLPSQLVSRNSAIKSMLGKWVKHTISLHFKNRSFKKSFKNRLVEGPYQLTCRGTVGFAYVLFHGTDDPRPGEADMVVEDVEDRERLDGFTLGGGEVV